MPANTPVRLNKFLADAGLSSRRGADELILAGRVQVNGHVQREPGVRVVPMQDKVQVNGQTVHPPLAGKQLEYVILNKPVHTVTTVRDPQDVPRSWNCCPTSCAPSGCSLWAAWTTCPKGCCC